MKTLLTIICTFVFFESFAQYNYPKTKTENISDDYFGVKIDDPYRWLEDAKNPEVQNWFKAQADFTTNELDKINGRNELFERMKTVSEMGGDKYIFPDQFGEYYYFEIIRKGENFGKLYRKNSKNGKEELFFDLQSYKKGSQLNQIKVNPQNDLIAIAIQDEGSELCEIIFMQLSDKKILDEKLYPMWREFRIEFTPDGKSLLYSKMSTSDLDSPSLLKNMKFMLHKIGTNPTSDKILASSEDYPELNILPEKFPTGYFSDDYKYCFLQVASVSNDVPIYYVPTSELSKNHLNWKPLIKAEDEISETAIFGDQLYFLTHKNAPNFKIGVTNIANPDFKNAKIVVPESDKIISDLQLTKNFLIFSSTNGITQEKFKLNTKDNSVIQIPLPTGINMSGSVNSRINDNVIVLNTGWLSPYTYFEFDAATNKLEKSKWLNSKNDYPDFDKLYTVKEIEIPGHDGVMIPLSIIYPKNLKLDGKNPTYINGYGGYGISLRPNFVDYVVPFFEKGGIYAVAHVRGGGEKGEKWHKDGMKDKKPNTWKDFISCAEYLVKEKYTSPEKLIGMGTSMGGVLIGGAITERPDLFAVAIDNVGMTQVLRNETTSNGDNQIPEVGSVKNKDDIKALIAMDVQSKVKKGVKYPATLVMTGINDSRIVPWMPAKFAAALQADSESGKPVFLRVNYNAGHGANDKYDAYKMVADIFAFGLWQTGHPQFQIKN